MAPLTPGTPAPAPSDRPHLAADTNPHTTGPTSPPTRTPHTTSPTSPPLTPPAALIRRRSTVGRSVDWPEVVWPVCWVPRPAPWPSSSSSWWSPALSPTAQAGALLHRHRAVPDGRRHSPAGRRQRPGVLHRPLPPLRLPRHIRIYPGSADPRGPFSLLATAALHLQSHSPPHRRPAAWIQLLAIALPLMVCTDLSHRHPRIRRDGPDRASSTACPPARPACPGRLPRGHRRSPWLPSPGPCRTCRWRC